MVQASELVGPTVEAGMQSNSEDNAIVSLARQSKLEHVGFLRVFSQLLPVLVEHLDISKPIDEDCIQT